MRALALTLILALSNGVALAQEAKPTPQWLAVLRPRADLLEPKNWTKADEAAVGAHFARLQAEAKAGRVIIGGRTLDQDASGKMPLDTLGLVVFEAPDRAAAEAWVKEDAAVKAGVMTATVHSYRIAVSRD